MSATDAKTRFTAGDSLSMPDGDRYELVDGRLPEKEVSEGSDAVAGRIAPLSIAFTGGDVLHGFSVKAAFSVKVADVFLPSDIS